LEALAILRHGVDRLLGDVDIFRDVHCEERGAPLDKEHEARICQEVTVG
jgi:hypothetical protein